jgi:phage shock protein E
MLSLLKKIFNANSADLSQLLKDGAVVIDVRTPAEFSVGNVKGSINIPLDQISSQAETLRKHKNIIVCCRSGNRSGQAKRILNAKGFMNVENGGSWQNVNQYK